MDKGGKGASDQEAITPSDNRTNENLVSGELGGGSGNVGPEDFFARLTPVEKQLLLLRDELYNGSWSEMETDLRNRLDKKPYIFRLMNRIEEDLARIDTIRRYEIAQGVNLGLFLDTGKDDNE